MIEANAQDAFELLGHIISIQPEEQPTDTLVYQYYQREGHLVWLNDDRLLPQADSLVAYLRAAVPNTGLSPQLFLIDSIASDLALLDSMAVGANASERLNSGTPTLGDVGSSEIMARLELNLSKALLRYSAGQRFGFTDPHRILNRLDRDSRSPGGYRQVFDIDLHRADSAFTANAMTRVDAGTAIGFVSSCEPTDSVYLTFQQLLKADSTRGDSSMLLMCNMERRRWRPVVNTDSSDRHVFVNIAAQMLWAIGPDSIQPMKICCGALATKTPLLRSRIQRVEVNPEWGIPMTIIRSEVSPHAGDSAYFARHRYYVTDGHTGKRVDPSTLTRQQMSSGRYAIRQYSGAGNSLGRLIFRFPNNFAVYLHDTSNRSAFKRDRRTISHGCVRVQHPFDMAHFLLPKADDKRLDEIRLSIDYRPETEWGKKYKKEHPGQIRLVSNIAVEPKVPVFIEYYTLLPNPRTGQMETWPDRYGYDKALFENGIKPLMP